MIRIKTFYFLCIAYSIVCFSSSCNTQKQAQNSSSDSTPSFSQASGPGDSVNIARNFIDGCKAKELGDYDKAIAYFKEVLKADPSNAPSMYEIAKIYFKAGSLEDAKQLAKTAVQIEPQNEYYQELYADVLMYSGIYGEAAKVYENLVQQKPDIDNYFQLVAIYEKANRPDDAIGVLKRMEKLYGSNENILNEEQMLYVKSGQLDKAIEILNQLIVSDPDEPNYYGMLAEIYEMQHNTQQADIMYQKLFEISPDNADLLFKKADLQKESGDIQAYYATLRSAFANPNADIDKKIYFLVPYVDSLDNKDFKIKDSVLLWTQLLTQAHPGDAKAYAMRGDFLFYTQQYAEARKSYRRSLAIRSDVYDVWTKIFYIDSDLMQNDSLKAVTDEAIELFPNQPLAYYFNGLALNRSMQCDQTIKVLKRAIPLTVANLQLRGEMYSTLGDAYNELKNYDESDKAFELALQLDPNNSYALNNYAYYLSLRGDKLDRAEQMAAKANDLKPNDASLLDTYAWVLFKEGKFAEAKKWQQKAIQNDGGKSGIILEHYGDILFKLGDIDQAVEQWKEAKARGGASDMIDKKINDRTYYE